MKKTRQGQYKADAARELWEPRKAEILWLYMDQRWPMVKIGEYFGVSQTGMGKAMKRLGIKSRGQARAGKENGRYIHGKSARPYRQLIDKVKCSTCPSTTGLVIHHKNGDHFDNRLENLQVLCSPCHTSHHKTLWWATQKSSA
jgi:hypothetical protein